MTIIDDELQELKKCCENILPDSKLVACVPAMVRVELKKSDFKTMAICLTYPSNYPTHHILVEIKSKKLSRKLLDGLEKVAETEAKKYIGKPHIIFILKMINQFFEDNPLACCSEEISQVKELLNQESDDAATKDSADGSSKNSNKSYIKLSQKTSSISVQVTKNKYYFKTKVIVPNNYPLERITFDNVDSNFPRIFKTWFFEQTKEIARRCVEPPLKPKPKDPPFEPRPSIGPAIGFLVKNVKRYPDEICQKCKHRAFPQDPSDAIHNENAAAHVERVYCSHVYHHDCLIVYMKTPPFQGGKKCLGCSNRIYHEKWKVTPELAEARWAHEQAKNRELGEVVEFFADINV